MDRLRNLVAESLPGLRVLQQEFGDRRDDCFLLFPRELRVDRDAQALRRETLAYRQRRIGPEVRETLLQVHGAGIIDFRSDLAGSQMLLQGVARISRRVFQRLLDQSPTPERCLEAYYLQRTRLELIAERKVRRRQLTDDANVEITGRDLREREAQKATGQMTLEWIAR